MIVNLKYRLSGTRRFRCGVSTFECRTGKIVTVRQVDHMNDKVLIDFGDRQIDWFHKSILEDFEPARETEAAKH